MDKILTIKETFPDSSDVLGQILLRGLLRPNLDHEPLLVAKHADKFVKGLVTHRLF